MQAPLAGHLPNPSAAAGLLLKSCFLSGERNRSVEKHSSPLNHPVAEGSVASQVALRGVPSCFSTQGQKQLTG